MKTEDMIRVIGISEDLMEIYLNDGVTIKSASGPFNLDELRIFTASSGAELPGGNVETGPPAARPGYTSYT